MFAISVLLHAFTLRLRGNHNPKIPPYYMTEALSLLRKYDPVHIDIVSTRVFEDEVIVDTTVYGRNGTRYEATARDAEFLPALREISRHLAQ